MTPNVSEIVRVIEELRKQREVGNEVARLVTFALTELNKPERQEEAILANRMIVQGADPYSIEIYNEDVTEGVRSAHFSGPGKLTGKDKRRWLILAYLSEDEAANTGLDVVQRVRRFFDFAKQARHVLQGQGEIDGKDGDQLAREMENDILSLPYVTREIGTRTMRLYESDRGFAAAYWDGEEFAAVRDADGLIFVGSQGASLADCGILVDKPLGAHFGIVFPKART